MAVLRGDLESIERVARWILQLLFLAKLLQLLIIATPLQLLILVPLLREVLEDASLHGCRYVEVGLEPTKLAVKGQVTQKEVVQAVLR